MRRRKRTQNGDQSIIVKLLLDSNHYFVHFLMELGAPIQRQPCRMSKWDKKRTPQPKSRYFTCSSLNLETDCFNDVNSSSLKSKIRQIRSSYVKMVHQQKEPVTYTLWNWWSFLVVQRWTRFFARWLPRRTRPKWQKCVHVLVSNLKLNLEIIRPSRKSFNYLYIFAH